MEDAVIEEESMKEIDIRRHFNTFLSFSFDGFCLSISINFDKKHSLLSN
jgi:hypothetical protein